MPPSSPDHEQEKIERLRRAMYSRSLSDQLKDKPRRQLEEVRPVVGDDFVHHGQTVQGTIVAPRSINLARRALWSILTVAIIFFVAALAFFGYYFLFGAGSGSASPSNIDMVVAGPPQIEGGTATELQITVTNRNQVPLDLADLVITYPSGTRSPTDFSTDLPDQRISLGTIEAGGQRQGTVSAVFAGEAGQQADVKVELEYHIGGSSAIFVASTDYGIVFSSSPLSLSVNGNSETVSDQPVQLAVAVTSNADAPVSDVLLSGEFPFGFTFSNASDPADTSFNPQPVESGDSNIWQLGDFSPGQTKTVTIQGKLDGSQGDNRVFHFEAGTQTGTSSVISTQLASETFPITISKPFLGLSVAVNGGTSPPYVVSPGDTVNVTINWQNNLPTPITNAAIVARLSGITIDGTTVRSTNGFYRSADGSMLWDKTTNASFASLAPGASGVVSFSFQMPPSSVLDEIVSPVLDMSVNAAGDRVDQTGVPENLQSAIDQKISVASDLELAAQGLYYSDPFGGTGPMPPEAGTETDYAVVFSVTNTTSKITNAAVTADLPPYVRWIGIYSPSSEHIYFKGGTTAPPAGSPCQGFSDDICWDLGEVDPGVGLNGSPARQAAIAIGFTPSTSQIGEQPALLQNITLTGTDASTGNIVTLSPQTNVTTNLLQVAETNQQAVIGTDPGFSAANATVVK